ncbi:hypothetical protein GOB93_07550 [Acetobacter musti]|uniref:Glycosyl transferase family 2 n=1 Tax=Acetobacter musti TaxID=864732 RepID=A0ABX0JR32_9PROT|nr:glycosyltransferase family 2 protein [Acetobacter musti]NHN84498.1 hypothetical protein [Acetobacter musti]
MKVAAVLVVENESDDVAWWIAHHAALGFSALIVCDNASTDGTWTLLQAARGVADVRPHRTDRVMSRDELRPFALEMAVSRYGSEFDLMGVFDIQDYLTPEPGAELTDLLPSPEEHAVDGVVFSVRIHGGNSYVGVPWMSPLQAYPRHAPEDFAFHEQGILFVRPKNVRERGAGRYVGLRPDGERFLTPAGRDAEAWNGGWLPEWSRACVRRFAVRSMTHRVRLLERTPGADRRDPEWFVLDRNDIDSGIGASGAGSQASVTEQIVGAIYRSAWSGFVRHRAFERVLSAPDTGMSGFGHTERPRFFTVRGSGGLVLAYDTESSRLFGCPDEELVPEGRYRRILVCVWESMPEWIVLVREDAVSDMTVCLCSDFIGVPQAFFPFEVRKTNGGDAAFWSPVLKRFLTMIDGDGAVWCNRLEVQGWETFRLEPVDGRGPDWIVDSIGLLPSVVREGLTAETFARLSDVLEIEQSGIIPLVFTMLPVEQQRHVLLAHPGMFPPSMLRVRD